MSELSVVVNLVPSLVELLQVLFHLGIVGQTHHIGGSVLVVLSNSNLDLMPMLEVLVHDGLSVVDDLFDACDLSFQDL